MRRAILVVLDSLGIGALPDAQRFGDVGANTLGHIAEHCVRQRCGSGSAGALAIPHLLSLGLGDAAALASGQPLAGIVPAGPARGLWGCARERSTGKDTTSGHWEMCGLPVDFDWGYFSAAEHSFPDSLLQDLIQQADLPGVLGNCKASGTEIIARLGAEHLRTGKPIFYTSADSVLQIAAHEEHFGLERLYRLCALARTAVDPLRIARVIARPFVGDSAQTFKRSSNRHDYSVAPHQATLLNHVQASDGEVVGIGKISDIFAGCGISRSVKAHGIDALHAATRTALRELRSGLVFVNFVDFDQDYGHRRDPTGYAQALEHYDRLLPELLADLGTDDLLLLTADHGNDPTWPGSDHTREHIPILAYAPTLAVGGIGIRESFCDIGQSIADWLGVDALACGESFLPRQESCA